MLNDPATNINHRGPPEFTLQITCDFALLKKKVAVCDVENKIVYLHPYFFTLSKIQQARIIYHELFVHIVEGLEDGSDGQSRLDNGMLIHCVLVAMMNKKEIERIDRDDFLNIVRGFNFPEDLDINPAHAKSAYINMVLYDKVYTLADYAEEFNVSESEAESALGYFASLERENDDELKFAGIDKIKDAEGIPTYRRIYFYPGLFRSYDIRGVAIPELTKRADTNRVIQEISDKVQYYLARVVVALTIEVEERQRRQLIAKGAGDNYFTRTLARQFEISQEFGIKRSSKYLAIVARDDRLASGPMNESTIASLKRLNEERIEAGLMPVRDVPVLSQAVIQAFIDSGVDVVDIGMTSTPALLEALPLLAANIACMNTASHSEVRWAGDKFLIGPDKDLPLNRELPDGKIIRGTQVLRFEAENRYFVNVNNGLSAALTTLAIVDKKENSTVVDMLINDIKATLQCVSIVDWENEVFRDNLDRDCMSSLQPYRTLEAVNKFKPQSWPGIFKGIKAVADCGNGMAARYVRGQIERLGAQVFYLNAEPDGTFPAHLPDPTLAENRRQLIEAMKEHDADLGFGYDTDVDRIFVVLRLREYEALEMPFHYIELAGDFIGAVTCKEVVKHYPATVIVGDERNNFSVKEIVEGLGCEYFLGYAGYTNIIQKMKERAGVYGFEKTGHFFPRWDFKFDDSVYISGLFTKVFQNTGKSAVKTLEGIKFYAETPDLRVVCVSSEAMTQAFNKVQDDIGVILEPYGFTVAYDLRNPTDIALVAPGQDMFVVLRTSGTEPLITSVGQVHQEVDIRMPHKEQVRQSNQLLTPLLLTGVYRLLMIDKRVRFLEFTYCRRQILPTILEAVEAKPEDRFACLEAMENYLDYLEASGMLPEAEDLLLFKRLVAGLVEKENDFTGFIENRRLLDERLRDERYLTCIEAAVIGDDFLSTSGMVIFDVDNTLAQRNLPLPEVTREKLISLLSKGHRVAIETGQEFKTQAPRIADIVPAKYRHCLIVYANEAT
ncbi:MAG: hypothetical protein PHW65_02060, partial [Dehalococcoidales bacterium]|nr:hypothetical protein [Dehalococcoidales bacterium]